MSLSQMTTPAQDLWAELKYKVDFMKAHSVVALETHMSWVFLTDKYAYKLKKPNSFPYLKLDTLGERFLNAQTELQVNQQLAPGVYLELVPLVMDEGNQLHLEDYETSGKVVEWLIKMKRISFELTMEQVIIKITEAARNLTNFYLTAPSVKISPETYHARFLQYVEENRSVLTRPKYGLDLKLVNRIQAAQVNFLNTHRDLFYQRVREGRIKECHGDLRPEHICLTSPPVIIDRLEFSQELRSLDPVDELTYLMLECEVLGDTSLAGIFLDTYLKESQDMVSPKMIAFYKSFRAALRAKISIWHLDDIRVSNQEKWKNKGKNYLSLAKLILE